VWASRVCSLELSLSGAVSVSLAPPPSLSLCPLSAPPRPTSPLPSTPSPSLAPPLLAQHKRARVLEREVEVSRHPLFFLLPHPLRTPLSLTLPPPHPLSLPSVPPCGAAQARAGPRARGGSEPAQGGAHHTHAPDVDAAIAAVREELAQGMDWARLKQLVKEEARGATRWRGLYTVWIWGRGDLAPAVGGPGRHGRGGEDRPRADCEFPMSTVQYSTLQYSTHTLLWSCGAVVLWCCGALVPLCPGAVVP